jgi:hypothetical protein
MIVGWEWMWARTKRLANLLLEPNILAGAVQLVERMDAWCEHNQVPQQSVQLGDAKFIRGLTYIEYPLERG